MKRLLLLLSVAIFSELSAQLPAGINSWILNVDSSMKGYNNIPSNVLKLQYSATQVYMSSACIPGYSIGPWSMNPNTPSNQNFTFKFTRNPIKNTGAGTVVGLGAIGSWTNGVAIYNAKDGMTYNNAGVWDRNAFYYEGGSFDSCLGHPDQRGCYHHHINPKCLYDDADYTHHSPIIGWAFDGFPIYGAYGYRDTNNATSPIKRMTSSYVLTTATTRTNGPAVSTTYPLGCYTEDYIYTAGAGDLDEHNGRFCRTPDYPNGTYAYFVTIDAALHPVYPFVLGPTYYGVVQQGNTGPGGGHVTITEATTSYKGSTQAGIDQAHQSISCQIVPNPTKDYVFVYMDNNSANNVAGKLYSLDGKLIQNIDYMQPAIAYTLDLSKQPVGEYLLHLTQGKSEVVKRIVKQ